MELYNCLSLLGKGTFGSVYLCERKHNQQKIVIKHINVEINDKDAKNEVNILKSLNHPNIIQFHDSFIKSGTLFIVMEYANKGTLFDYIVKNKPKRFQPQTVMNLFCQILMGLNHIHSKKVIHRDLKCENIFLTGLQSDVVKIGDFDANNYAHYVFNTIKHKQHGKISFEDFLSILSKVSRGSVQEKLQWIFGLYDLNGDGLISKPEMLDVVTSIYEMLGRATHPTVNDSSAKEHVEKIFHLIDKNRDGVVTIEELVQWCSRNENVLQSLETLDTVL